MTPKTALGSILIAALVGTAAPLLPTEPAAAQSAIVISSSTVLARQSWLNALEFEGRMCQADQAKNWKAKLFWASHLGRALHEYSDARGYAPKLPPCEQAMALLTYER